VRQTKQNDDRTKKYLSISLLFCVGDLFEYFVKYFMKTGECYSSCSLYRESKGGRHYYHLRDSSVGISLCY
jgi:hypothetical protein